MLRGGGLRQPCRLGQRADTALAPLHQLAQHHQPPLVGERSEDAGDHGGVGLKRGEIGGSAGHCEALSILALANLVGAYIYVNERSRISFAVSYTHLTLPTIYSV